MMKCFPAKPRFHRNLQSHYLRRGHPWGLTSRNCLVRSGSRCSSLFRLFSPSIPKGTSQGYTYCNSTLAAAVVSRWSRAWHPRERWELCRSRPTLEIAILAQGARRQHHEPAPHQPVTCSPGQPHIPLPEADNILETALRRLAKNLEFISKCYF